MAIDLPYQIKCIHFQDIYEMADQMKAFHWNMVHKQIEPGAFRGELLVAQLGGMQFARMTYNKAIRSWGDSPPGSIAIAFPFAVPEALHWHGYSLPASQALLQKNSVGLDFLRRGNFPLGLVSIDIASLLEAARAADKEQIKSLVLDGTLVIQPEVKSLARLRCHLQHLFHLIQTQAQQVLSTAIGERIRRHFIPLILDVFDLPDNSAPLRPFYRYGLIKQAEAMVMESLDRPLSIFDLCKQLDVSERTLRYGFQEYFGIAPAAYLKMQRLNGAKEQLKSAAEERLTITEVAIKWGFWHMGQFAKDYKKMFGESPSETLRRCS